jgi:hypothetical protein
VPRLRLAIDLAYDSSVSSYSSLGRQLACLYGLMRKAEGPEAMPSLHLTSAHGQVRQG